MVSAYGTVVDDDIPSPQRYSVPLDMISYISLSGPEDGITFLTSNLFLPSEPVSAPDFADLTTPFGFAGAEEPASGISTSAMATYTVHGSLSGEVVVKRDVCSPRKAKGGRWKWR